MSRPSIKNKRIQNGSIFYLMQDSENEQWVDFQLMSDHLDQVIEYQKQLQMTGGKLQAIQQANKKEKNKKKKRKGKNRDSTKSKIDCIKKEQSSVPTNISSNFDQTKTKDKTGKPVQQELRSQNQSQQNINQQTARISQFVQQLLGNGKKQQNRQTRNLQFENQQVQPQQKNSQNEKQNNSETQKSLYQKQQAQPLSLSRKFDENTFKQEIVELIFLGKDKQGKNRFEVLRQDGCKEVLTSYQIRKQNPYILLDFYEKYVEEIQ